MTEREKMLSGALYASEDPELAAARIRARTLCGRLNQTPPEEREAQEEIIRRLFASVGENSTVNPVFWCDYGSNITAGDNFYVNYNCVILDCAPVTFGDNVFIAPNCGFYTAGHPLDAPTRNAGLEYARPITVGSDVWFGGNVVVLPGVTIGSGSVIGAGSVVTRDIPDNRVAAGNPCRVPTGCELGKGILEMEQLIAIDKETKVEYIVLETHEGWVDGCPIKSLKTSAEYLAKKL